MRFFSMGSFLLSIGAFFLPWLDVRCEMGGDSRSVMTQSGYEVATGKFTAGSKEAEEKAGQKGPGGVGGGPEASPVIYGYLGIVILGAVLSIALPKTLWQKGAIACVASVIAVMVLQLVHGFPIESSIKELQDRMDNQMPQAGINAGMPKGGGIPFGGGGFGGGGLGDVKMGIKVRYALGYYLAWLLGVLPLAAVALDAMMGAKPKPRPRMEEVGDEPEPAID